jgi:hypothetical protein
MALFIDLVTIHKRYFTIHYSFFMALGNEIKEMEIEKLDIPSGSLARNLDGIGLSK